MVHRLTAVKIEISEGAKVYIKETMSHHGTQTWFSLPYENAVWGLGLSEVSVEVKMTSLHQSTI